MPGCRPRRCSASAPRSASFAASTGAPRSSSAASIGGERDVPPPEVRGEVHEPVGPSGDADHRDTDADEHVLGRERIEQRAGQLRDVLDRLFRGEATPGSSPRGPGCTRDRPAPRSRPRSSRRRARRRAPSRRRAGSAPSARGAPGPTRADPGRSSTSPRAVSSPSRSAMVDRLRPVILVRSDRDRGPDEVEPLEHRTEVVAPDLVGGDAPAGTERGSADRRLGAADVVGFVGISAESTARLPGPDRRRGDPVLRSGPLRHAARVATASERAQHAADGRVPRDGSGGICCGFRLCVARAGVRCSGRSRNPTRSSERVYVTGGVRAGGPMGRGEPDGTSAAR